MDKAQLVIDREYKKALETQLQRNNKILRICAYQWAMPIGDPSSPISQLTRQVILAAQSGTDVRLITTDLEIKRKLTEYGVKVKVPNDSPSMHTKAIAFDERALLIGSHNLTNRAMQTNKEMSVLIAEYEPIAQYIKYFDTLWRNYG